jgi:hypothetical protein
MYLRTQVRMRKGRDEESVLVDGVLALTTFVAGEFGDALLGAAEEFAEVLVDVSEKGAD